MITLTVRLFLSGVLLLSGKLTRMTEEKTTRELVYEANRDVNWICRALQRMEGRNEDSEDRLRALVGWRAEKVGEEQPAEECDGRNVRSSSTVRCESGGSRWPAPGPAGWWRWL
ncbi:hypothetical protein DSECCO2_19070 [anaerobic digester metagenome]